MGHLAQSIYRNAFTLIVWCILCKTAGVPFLRYLQAERNKVHHTFCVLEDMDANYILWSKGNKKIKFIANYETDIINSFGYFQF